MAKDTEKKTADKKSSKNAKKPNKIASWFKGFWSEVKRIVWPDGKTVFRNTVIVIVVVAIAAAVIYLFDQGMSLGLKGIKSLAGEKTTAAADSTDAQTSQEALDEMTEETTTEAQTKAAQ
ncbi:MAG: preprotein translocase subunit SecE [Ruminococcaceae bacterium]|nr:preprotein translocase subunit SecE [Oscillospiraceae bacterium]